MTDNSLESKEDGIGEYLCDLSEVQRKRRFRLKDRDIVIIKLNNGKVYALDSFCYHAGGPLHSGDIEDFGGRTCLVCPWHKYKVCVETGEMVYQAIDPQHPKVRPVWKSSGRKQRSHQVNIDNGKIYVNITCANEQKLDSDYYNSKEFRDKNGL